MNKIRIGTRGSKLALRQAALVQEAMERACGDIVTELVILRTRGDRIQDRPLSALGDKGVFASELERALLAGQIDLAVHSAKDLPMKLADGLTTAAVLPRADARDVLVAPKGGRVPVLRQNLYGERELVSVEDTEKKDRAGSRAWREVCRGCEGRLAEESTARAMSGDGGHIFRLGTGSRRRQLLAGKIWENVICEEIRGNVDTRLRKLQEGRYDGIILAKAGLDRLGIGSDGEEAFDFYPLSPEVFLPAACQGILAVEAVEGSAAAGICKKISDAETELCYFVEREALAQLSADCSEAAAAWCRLGKYGHNCGGERESAMYGPEAGREQAGHSLETAGGAGRLLLDVMYAERRINVTGLVNIEEGRRLAREAARKVKSRQEKTACGAADNGTEKQKAGVQIVKET
jgi:porphobilinogen deaminase